MGLGRWVLLVAVVGALGFGGWRLLWDGRFRGTHRVRGSRHHSTDEGGGLDPAEPPQSVGPTAVGGGGAGTRHDGGGGAGRRPTGGGASGPRCCSSRPPSVRRAGRRDASWPTCRRACRA